MEQVDILITAASIVTVDAERRILRDGALAIRGSDIVALGPRDEVLRKYNGVKRIHAPNGLVTPGLIDVHNHPIDYLVKGAVDDTPQIIRLRDRVVPYEDQLSHEEAYAASMGTFIEMISQGTTCFADAAGPQPDAVASAALDAGIRGVVTRKLADQPGPFGGRLQQTDEAIELANQTVDKYNGAGNGRLRAWYDIDMPSVVSPRLQAMVSEAARKRGVGVTGHLIGRRAPPGSPEVTSNADLDQLEQAGLLGPHMLLAHIGWLPEGDFARLARTGANIAHCPGTSLVGGAGWLAHGVIPELVAAGVNVALGTDAVIIARHLDMVRMMRDAACVHKEARRDPLIMNPYKVFEMATINGARALGWADRIGSLEVGKAADLAIFDVDAPFNWATSFGNEVPDFVYGGTGRDARTVVINGKVVLEEGRITHLDIASIGERIKHASHACFDRLGFRPSQQWPK